MDTGTNLPLQRGGVGGGRSALGRAFKRRPVSKSASVEMDSSRSYAKCVVGLFVTSSFVLAEMLGGA
jgi:hypothetical protein